MQLKAKVTFHLLKTGRILPRHAHSHLPLNGYWFVCWS